MRGVRFGLALASILLLSGCGVRFASVADREGRDLMLLGHDPVAYFTMGKPIKGDPALAAEHEGVWYYFARAEHREMFKREPAKYAPQYGAFCASGAAYGVKLGSDPTEFAIRGGRLFIFGDVLGREYWYLDPEWHIRHADQIWPEAGASGHRWQSIKRILFTVPWYKNAREGGLWTARAGCARTRFLSARLPRIDLGRLPAARLGQGPGERS